MTTIDNSTNFDVTRDCTPICFCGQQEEGITLMSRKLNCSRTWKLLFSTIGLVFFSAGSVMATAISYGDFAGSTVTYVSVQEESATDPGVGNVGRLLLGADMESCGQKPDRLYCGGGRGLPDCCVRPTRTKK